MEDFVACCCARAPLFLALELSRDQNRHASCVPSTVAHMKHVVKCRTRTDHKRSVTLRRLVGSLDTRRASAMPLPLLWRRMPHIDHTSTTRHGNSEGKWGGNGSNRKKPIHFS